MPELSVYVNDCYGLWAAIKDSGDKLMKTAVEKIHLTECQNLV